MIAKPLSKRDLDVGCVLPVPNDRVVSSTEVTHPKGFSQMRVASRWTTGCMANCFFSPSETGGNGRRRSGRELQKMSSEVITSLHNSFQNVIINRSKASSETQPSSTSTYQVNKKSGRLVLLAHLPNDRCRPMYMRWLQCATRVSVHLLTLDLVAQILVVCAE